MIIDKDFLIKKANWVRDEILRVCIPNGAGHIAPSLSCVDILIALYYGNLSYKPGNPQWEDRDRLIVSKSHGVYGVYPILVDLGFLPKEDWDNYYKEGKSRLWGCMERDIEVGIEAGCGSLGHGLPLAVGVAFGAKLQNKNYHTFCLIGDAEMEEGTTWEAIQFAVKHNLKNLIILIDKNGLAAMDYVTNIMDKDKDSLIRKLKGFDLAPVICPGHDVIKLSDCIKIAKETKEECPQVIVAETIKGYGLKCMENMAKFHFRIPNENDLKMGKSY